MKGYLVLADGSVFKGNFLNSGICQGEVVFNTGMTGYQEILTDPSYKGQIVVMTYPLIGNYGVCNNYAEKSFVSVQGFIASEIADIPSNYTSTESLGDYLKDRNIPVLVDVDTRKLVRHIREVGDTKGFILDEKTFIKYAGKEFETIKNGVLEKISKVISPSTDPRDFVKSVSTKKIYRDGNGAKKVALIDFGAKENIIRDLKERDCTVIVMPHDVDAAAVLKENPEIVLLSNGPGNPKDQEAAVETVKQLIGKIPVYGICLGHQIISLALGCDTYKLKYGHRGCNHPVKDLNTGKVYITSQNHGYAVDERTISDDIEITHINLNDGTVEGIRHKFLPVFSVQYHPEAAPGPKDSGYIFNEFLGVGI